MHQTFPNAFTHRKDLRRDLKEARDVSDFSRQTVPWCGGCNSKSQITLCHKMSKWLRGHIPGK